MEIEENKSTEGTRLLPDEVKWKIVFLKKEGNSNKQVARIVSEEYERPMSHQTVQKIWTLYQDTGLVECQWSKKGRPRTLNNDQIGMLIENCEDDRTSSVKERRKDLNLEASRSTINKTLLELGYKAYKARKKPVLTVDNIRGRLQFAREYKDWTFEDWSNVIFTDECSFRLVNSNGRVFIRRTEEEIWHEDNFQPHLSQSRSVMVWGAISINGCGPLVPFDENINSDEYLDAFRYRLRRFYPGLYGGDMIFQHDNSPVHTAQVVSDLFQDKNIRVLDWPSKSPDLNIIENVWGLMKYELRSQVFEDLDLLWSEVARIWENSITENFIKSLYESIPRRIRAVIQSSGHHTKY